MTPSVVHARIPSGWPQGLPATHVRPGVQGAANRRVLDDDAPPQRPLGRLAAPRDIANGILLLASDESSYTTGSKLVIDGGISAR